MVFQMMDSYFLGLGFSRWTSLAPSASGAALRNGRIRSLSAAPVPTGLARVQTTLRSKGQKRKKRGGGILDKSQAMKEL